MRFHPLRRGLVPVVALVLAGAGFCPASGTEITRDGARLLVGGRSLGTFTCPPSKETFEEGPAFTKTWPDVAVHEGDLVEVRARTASNDGKENSRARWSKLVFTAIEDDPAMNRSASK